MTARSSAEQHARYGHCRCLFAIDGLTPYDVHHHRRRLWGSVHEQGDTRCIDGHGNLDPESRPACGPQSASRAVDAAVVKRTFATTTLLAVTSRSGNVRI